MPTSPQEDVPARTIRDLGLPVRAVTALLRAGVTGAEDLALLTRQELAAIPGLGPGGIAAIRGVLPEPPARPGSPPGADDEESPAAPAIPSFDSLRAPRRRSAVDLLVPGPGIPPSPAAPADPPRPPEYADLLPLALRAARALAGVPGRLVLWSVGAPVRTLRRLLGREPGTGRG